MLAIVAGLTLKRALKISFWMHLLFWLVWVGTLYTFTSISFHFMAEAWVLWWRAAVEGGFSNASQNNGRTVSAPGELSLGVGQFLEFRSLTGGFPIR